jgi:hypothetical protein
MEFKKAIKIVVGMKKQNSSKTNSHLNPNCTKNKYVGPQLALAQQAVNYCGDHSGDGCPVD